MMISTYSQPIHIRQVSLFSKALLVLAIVIGSNGPLEFFLQKRPDLIPLNTLVWFILYLAATAGLMLNHGINWITWLVRYRMLLVMLLAGALFLTPWSVEPTLSVNRLAHLFGTTLVAIYIGFSVPMTHILKLFSATLFVLLLASLIAGQLLPGYAWEIHGDSLALKGIMDNKNTLGFWAAMSLLLFPWTGMQQKDVFVRVFWGCSAVMAIIVLLQSRSAGSMIAIIAAVAVMAYFTVADKLKLGFLAMAVIGTLLAIILTLIIGGLNVAEITGRSEDLTGRTEVWEQTWSLIQQRPLTGYGYGTLWFPTDSTRWIQERYTDFTWIVYHAHNGGLQVASEIGLPMTALALLFIMQQLVELVFCQLRQKHVGSLVVLGFTLAFLISNYSEARFLQSRELFWLFFIALPICMVRQVEVRTVDEHTATAVSPRPVDARVRYPDEYIPNTKTKLGRLRAIKKIRRLRRDVVSRLAAPRG